ncbi:quinone oxidoreductase family protein [Spirillospora sp. CA-255316]
MRVVQISRFGPPEVLEPAEAANPRPGPGQVLVEVEAAGVNFIDTWIRSGRSAPPAGLRPPFVPGNEIGGVIREVGADVPDTLLGQRVVTAAGGSGGYAERVAVSAAGVVEVPAGVDLREATAVFVQGRVAMGALRAAGLTGTERVVVLGAAGGVGSLLIQLARHAEARTVIGVVHGEHDQRVVKGLGADTVVDHEHPDFAGELRRATGGTGPDVVFDGLGGAIAVSAVSALADGVGRIVVYGFATGEPLQASAAELVPRGISVIGFGGQARIPGYQTQLVTEVLEQVRAGRIRPLVGQTFPLERAADAHAAIENRRTFGKTLLIPGDAAANAATAP